MRVDSTIGNLTCGDVKISLVVIPLALAGIKKDRAPVPSGFIWGKGEKEWCDSVYGGVFR